MNKQKSEQFKKLITTQLSALKNEIESSRITAAHTDVVYADSIDTASAETDKDMQVKIRNRELAQLRKLEEALLRLDAGNFGICLSCEEEITEARLKARPSTTLCVDCQAQLESENHMQKFMI